jgi:hypothetical protein
MGKGRHLRLDHRSWRTNTLALVVCTNILSSKDAYIHTYINTYVDCTNFSSLDLRTSVDTSVWTVDLGVEIL